MAGETGGWFRTGPGSKKMLRDNGCTPSVNPPDVPTSDQYLIASIEYKTAWKRIRKCFTKTVLHNVTINKKIYRIEKDTAYGKQVQKSPDLVVGNRFWFRIPENPIFARAFERCFGKYGRSDQSIRGISGYLERNGQKFPGVAWCTNFIILVV